MVLGSALCSLPSFFIKGGVCFHNLLPAYRSLMVQRSLFILRHLCPSPSELAMFLFIEFSLKQVCESYVNLLGVHTIKQMSHTHIHTQISLK